MIKISDNDRLLRL